MAGGLHLHDIRKSFGEIPALRGVSFGVAEGEILAVLGPSGCGKSTLLALIAGLDAPDRGEIRWAGQDLGRMPTHLRGFGLMFQDFALFPHLNVFENIAFGLRMLKLPGEQVRKRAVEALELVGLPGYGGRDVNTLSGGEVQRVALARSLAPRPRLLMLDEPLGALDRALRERLVGDLSLILPAKAQTTIYVTHDQEEAFALADRVVLLNGGQVEQVGSPLEIYRSPGSVFVARFLGMSNILEGEAYTENGRCWINTAVGSLPLSCGAQGRLTVLLRLDGMRLGCAGDYTLEGRLVHRSFRGSLCKAILEIKGVELGFEFPSTQGFPLVGEMICLSLDSEQVVQILEK